MPQSFADAVFITRKLRVRYLWIDSLCIIQDSHEDWATEAAKMRDVYANSFLTISAAMVEDSHQGFLRKRNEDTLKSLAELEHPIPNSNMTGKIYLRPDFDSWSRTIVNGTLAQRAWTLQERLLARRVLHFGDAHLFWECGSICTSERCLEPNQVRANEQENPLFSKSVIENWGDHCSLSIPNPIDRWYIVVEEYTKRGLTKDSDKLPAISGLAKEVHTKTGGWAYYWAGLWQPDMHRGMLWTAVVNAVLKSPSSYRAPSWSWAALNGPVKIHFDRLDRRDKRYEALFLGGGVTSKGFDRFGEVTGGHLLIRACFRWGIHVEYEHVYIAPMVYGGGLPTTAGHPAEGPQSREYFLFEEKNPSLDEDKPGTLRSFCKCWLDQPLPSKKRVYGFLRIGHYVPLFTMEEEVSEYLEMQKWVFQRQATNAKWITWALILDELNSEADIDTYKRIGVAEMELGAFDEASVSTVKVY